MSSSSLFLIWLTVLCLVWSNCLTQLACLSRVGFTVGSQEGPLLSKCHRSFSETGCLVAAQPHSDALSNASVSRTWIGLTAIKHSLWTPRWKRAVSFLLPEGSSTIRGRCFFFFFLFVYFILFKCKSSDIIAVSVAVRGSMLWEAGNMRMKGSSAKGLQSSLIFFFFFFPPLCFLSTLAPRMQGHCWNMLVVNLVLYLRLFHNLILFMPEPVTLENARKQAVLGVPPALQK